MRQGCFPSPGMSAWRAAIIMKEAGEEGNFLRELVLGNEDTVDSALFPDLKVNLREVNHV